VLGGNQVNVPISVPINVCGNAVALLGQAYAGCKGGAAVLGHDSSGTWSTSGNGSVAGGNQINAPVRAPVNACGNAVAVAGISDAGCKGGAVVADHPHGHKPWTPPTTPPTTPTTPTTPPVTPPHHGGQPGGPGSTTTSLTSSTLPTTGADLAAIGGAGLAAVGLGAVSVVAMRRKRATSGI
jgi:LPXTG-motif cell wall-anchored protein